MKIKLRNFNTNPDLDCRPRRAHYNDAGADVFSTKNVLLFPNTVEKIPLGFGLELPDGLAAFIFPRTGWSSKGLTPELPPIDSGYTGEIHAIVTNNTSEPIEIRVGDRVGQLVITPCILADFVDDLGDERGNSGFGATGR